MIFIAVFYWFQRKIITLIMKYFTGTRTDSPENSSVYLKHPTVGTEADGDKMEMLHRQVSESCPRKRKSIGGRKRLQANINFI